MVKIVDGDTLTILVAGNEQKRIGLSEIDTPERRQPWSRNAKQALTDKVAGETVDVEVVTTDRYDRTVGKVWIDGRDINRELIAEGHAWGYRKYMTDDSLLEDEQAAREAGRGFGACRRPSGYRLGSGGGRNEGSADQTPTLVVEILRGALMAH